jgi:hypothetical protein
VPGNHEYDDGYSNADGYFDYFNGRGQDWGIAGQRGRGYYSFDMGDWHFVARNTSDGCRTISCEPGSPMHTWLLRDLAAAKRRCVLAYFHHPRFLHTAVHGDALAVAPLWDALVDARADVVLAGHEHNFQYTRKGGPSGDVVYVITGAGGELRDGISARRFVEEGIAGVAKVVRAAYPDRTARDPRSRYHDAAASDEDPRWYVVDLGFVEAFSELVSLSDLKSDKALSGMEVTRRGSRLSVHPVTSEHFAHVVELGRRG